MQLFLKTFSSTENKADPDQTAPEQSDLGLHCLYVYYCVGGLTTRQPLWVILCRLPEKGRKEIEEIVEEMKERNREERGTEMKGKKQKK